MAMLLALASAIVAVASAQHPLHPAHISEDLAPPLHPVHVEKASIPGQPVSWRFVDSIGRERLFRGVNVVYKDPPWLPTATEFNTNFSFVTDDAKLLASMGFNLIRLGVMWPGVNPESMDQVFWPRFSVPFSLNFSMSRWQVNMTYIDEIKKLIAIAAAEGIYSFLDPHRGVTGNLMLLVAWLGPFLTDCRWLMTEDEMNPRYCGEGAPNWWVKQHTEVGDFPVPVRSEPFPINASRPCPGLEPEQCPVSFTHAICRCC